VLLDYLKAQKRAGTKKHCSFFVKGQKGWCCSSHCLCEAILYWKQQW